VRLTGEVISGVLATKMLGGCRLPVHASLAARTTLRLLLGLPASCVCCWLPTVARPLCAAPAPANLCPPACLPASPPKHPAGWEGPFLAQIGEIRRREEGYIRSMSRIKAFNMGLSYCITPLVSLPGLSGRKG
jgi:hypothetical protein